MRCTYCGGSMYAAFEPDPITGQDALELTCLSCGRGTTPPRPARPITRCKRGLHLLTPDNQVARADGRGRCKACRQAYQRAWDRTHRVVRPIALPLAA